MLIFENVFYSIVCNKNVYIKYVCMYYDYKASNIKKCLLYWIISTILLECGCLKMRQDSIYCDNY